jgi:fluoroacetyl-CoA thioesterase
MMPREELRPGLRHVALLDVTEALTVPGLASAFGAFADMPPLFATACMVGFIEATCIEALCQYLAPHERTVGTGLEVNHRAAMPIGMTVTAEVELVEVDGRRLRFRVACRDEVELIGQGQHECFIVDAARFLTGVEGKQTPGPGCRRADDGECPPQGSNA